MNEELSKYRIEKIKAKEGVRYLLQELRTDAVKPYWLTFRIFITRSTAEIGLKKILRGEKPP